MRNDLPEWLLGWREGDEITERHRNALADFMAKSFNLPPHEAEKTRQDHARVPAEDVGYSLAVMIATATRLDTEAFKRRFPIAAQSRSLVVTAFLAYTKAAPEQNGGLEDLGDIG